MTKGPSRPPRIPSADPGGFGEWMHRLRNEINTATMAAAAASSLLDHGQLEQARVNLDRAQRACRRSTALLERQPPEGRR